MKSSTTLQYDRPTGYDSSWNESAVALLKARYLHRFEDGTHESIEDRFWSVATTIANVGLTYGETEDQVYEWAKRYYHMMISKLFLPNSPTLMNAGKNNGLQMAACFVLPIEDDLASIFDTMRDAALIHQSGGGTGFAFSRLRSRDTEVGRTQGKSSGPIPFLQAYDAATNTIMQGGKRRGANMAVLRIDHPDIEEFITSKISGGITNFNISVGITEDFISRVKDKNDTPDFPLVDPHTHLVTKYVSAMHLWDQIVDAAWKTGDPGCIFLDKVNQSAANPLYPHEIIEATNPCLSGDTLIATTEGPRTFKELADDGSDVLVYAWNPDDKQPVIRWMRKPRLTRKNVPVLAIEFDSGLVVKATPDHNFYTFRGNKIMAKDLKVGQSVRAFAAYVHRDGQVRVHAGNSAPKYLHRLMYEALVGEIPEGMIVHHLDHNPMNNDIENFTLYNPSQHNVHHYPDRYANGFRGHKNFPEILAAAKARKEAEVGNHKVISITEAGYADVYNGTVDDVHTYIVCDPNYRGKSGEGLFSGIVSANCGEQALPPNDVCNLGSINLGEFVLPDRSIDFQLLDEVIRAGTRFLDSIIDINPVPIPKVVEQMQSTRRIGLGVMGWHDMLLKLGIPYESFAAQKLGEDLMKRITEVSHDESRKLGEERGSFPKWHLSKFYQPDTYMRNNCITMVAPTGSIAIIAGCSNGIEPMYALSYKHHSKIEGDEKILSISYPSVEEALRFEMGDDEYHIQQALSEVIARGSLKQAFSGTDLEKLFAVAPEISWEQHIKMQAAWQRYCDNGISKTINMPNSATREDISNAYMMAYDTDCRGTTIFRDGSKGFEGQVLHAPEINDEPDDDPFTFDHTDDDFIIGNYYRRRGYIYTVDSPEGKAHVTIAVDKHEQPRELFVNVGRAGSDIAVFSEVIGRLTSLALAERISPQKVIHQLQGLNGSEAVGFGPNRVTSLPDAVSKALSQQVELAEAISYQAEVIPGARTIIPTARRTGNSCPTCGSFALYQSEGCVKCSSCGWSKC